MAKLQQVIGNFYAYERGSGDKGVRSDTQFLRTVAVWRKGPGNSGEGRKRMWGKRGQEEDCHLRIMLKS